MKSFKLLFLMALISFASCKKDTISNMALSDGMIVFTLDGHDWKIKDGVASYTVVTGTGESIAISGSATVGVDVYKSIQIIINHKIAIANGDYPFAPNASSVASINIEEGKTTVTGNRYRTVNPDNGTIASGTVTVSSFDKANTRVSGSFSGEIFKSSYAPDTANTQYSAVRIQNGRFNNIPVLTGK
jgi:hypothetical protein